MTTNCGTREARVLDGHDTLTITIEAALGAVADAGLGIRDVDGVVSPVAADVAYQGRIGPALCVDEFGIGAVLSAASAIAVGLASVVVVCDGAAGSYRNRRATAPWTRPENEFVAPYGMFTAAEFALVARRHMHTYGTKAESLATAAATVRNNGHVNPQAVYYDRGPFTPEDILASRMVSDPYHLLDCAMTAEGGSGLVLARADIAANLARPPVWILGAGMDRFGPSYQYPPSFDLGSVRRPDLVNGRVGRRAAENAFSAAGLRPADVDVCELYDPFSFEIIRQFEAFGFCAEGEGGDFVMDMIGPGCRYPVTTDGGTMSFSHIRSGQIVQRVIRGVQQLRGDCPTRQVQNATVALCTGGGSGALTNDVLILGAQQA